MIARVLDSWPDDKVSRLTGIGIPSEVGAYWKEIRNATPQELHPGEVVSVDLRRDGRGVVSFANIRILVGVSERDASSALKPRMPSDNGQRGYRRR